MKKTLTVTTLALLAGAASVYAQGIVSMADLNGAGIQVFNSQPIASSTSPVIYGGKPGLELIGNSGDSFSYNTSAGPTVAYAPGSALGAGYSVELLAGPASDTLVSQLAETGLVISTWFTGSQSSGQGGFWNSVANATVAGVPAGGNAAVAIAAWNNEGGTIQSLAAAQAAGAPWGVSNVGAAALLGGGTFQPPSPTGLESFSLIAAVPEPSTIALGVIGASALLFRRKK
jgi:hypothetical protein